MEEILDATLKHETSSASERRPEISGKETCKVCSTASSHLEPFEEDPYEQNPWMSAALSLISMISCARCYL